MAISRNDIFKWLGSGKAASVLRLATVVLVFLMFAAWLGTPDSLSNFAMVKLLAFFSAFLLTGTLYGLYGTKMFDVLCVLLLMWTCFETITALLQLFGALRSNNHFFAMTGTFDNPNPFAALLSTGFCVLVYWQSRCSVRSVRVITVILLCLIFVILPATKCRGAFVGLVTGLAFTGLAWKNGWRTVFKKWCWLIVITLAAVSAFLYLWKKDSADGRLFLDRMCIVALAEKPLSGGGLGHCQERLAKTQMNWFGRYLEIEGGLPEIPDEKAEACRASGPVSYAFCDAFQIGLECGLPGMLVFIIVILLAIGRLLAIESPFAGGMIALAVTGLFSYTLCLWQFGLLNAAFMGVASCDGSQRNLSWRTVFGIMVSVTPLIIVSPYATHMIRDWKAWNYVRPLYSSRDYGLYADYCDGKSGKLGFCIEYMIEYGTALALSGNTEKSDSVLMEAYGFTGNQGFLIQLGNNSLERGDYMAAEDYYWKSFLSVPDRLMPLVCLANAYYQQADTARLKPMLGFIDSFHPQVETAATDDLRKQLESIRL